VATGGSEFVVQALVSLGAPAVIAAGWSAWISRKRSRAEVDQAQAGAAKTEAERDVEVTAWARNVVETSQLLLQPVQEQILTLSSQITDLRAQLVAAEQESRELRTQVAEGQRVARATAELLAEHSRWDALVVESLHAHAIQVPPPPPLRIDKKTGTPIPLESPLD
jgi:hypothetical protein